MSTKNVYEGVKSILDGEGGEDARKSVLGFVDSFVDNTREQDVGMRLQGVQAAARTCITETEIRV